MSKPLLGHTKRGVIFCPHCGDILGEDKHHADCPTRKGKVWKFPNWVKANRSDEEIAK